MDEIAQLLAIENMEIAEILVQRPQRRFHLREDPFEVLSDALFLKCFRLSKELTRYLINMLDPHLAAPSRISAIDKQTKVLVALQFFASGCYQINVGLNIFVGLNQSSISRCIHEVVEALNDQAIFNEWVHFPNTIRELEKVRLEFYNSYGFPGVIGCIDCTHIAIFPPNSDDDLYPEHIYVNRKNYHSINVQLICDAKLKVLNVNARFPGSTHDAHVWSQSNIQDAVTNLSRRHPDFFLIGDSGYPLRPWLQTPLADPPPDTPEYDYNVAFKRTRSAIERCNGLLKMRFRCLLKHRVLHYAPTMCSKIINACIVLHNMCIEYNIPPPQQEDGDDMIDFGLFNNAIIEENENPNENVGVRQNRDLLAGRNTQRRIIRNYFTR